MKVITLKTCTKCEKEKPATIEYFSRDKKRKDGLQYWCKSCYNDYRKANRKRINAQKKQYYQENKERLLERGYEWRRNNPELRKRADRRYRSRHREQRNAYNRGWRKRRPDLARGGQQRYWRRRNELTDTFTDSDWKYALEYFNHSCVICGSKEDIETDHWIPISAPKEINPGTVPANIIPLCRSCNASKFNFMPHEFLLRIHGEIQSWVILSRVNEYFAHLKAADRKAA